MLYASLRMRRLSTTASFLGALFITLLSSGCGGAATPPTETAAHAAPRAALPRTRSLPLWVVRSPDGLTSYVLGTYHMGVHIDEVLPPMHAAALDNARVLLVELDLANTDPAEMMPYLVLPPDQDLHDLIPPDLWPRLVSTLVDTIPEPNLHHLRPWAVMSLLMSQQAGAEESERRGEATEGPSVLDMQVMERARAYHVPIRPLETAREQGELMASLPTSMVVDYLDEALKGDQPSHRQQAELLEAYLHGDDETAESILLDSFGVGRERRAHGAPALRPQRPLD